MRTRPARSCRLTIATVLTVAALASCGGDDSDVTTTPAPAASAAPVFELIDATAAQQLIAAPPAGLVVLDVRTPEEFATGHLPGAIDLDARSDTFTDELAQLDREVPYLVYCHSGNRSAAAVATMRELGFTRVSELDGGITAWQFAGIPITT
ncbi:MAG: rhodanese-like domain-containing protein [Actinobacteria bacterium]|nr:rhodanese-like domain-containing protein [Actinomycetota bacterium]